LKSTGTIADSAKRKREAHWEKFLFASGHIKGRIEREDGRAVDRRRRTSAKLGMKKKAFAA